ncbi:MAG: hypothetical protein FIB08_04020 [Candidatus Methanoperedens sp.]|nr:hypothetical protein [Candidatus Methanoperedens sp.]
MPGQAGILEDINETYIHNIDALPYSPGIPEKSIQTSGHITGWIDIVGFRQMTRDNGTDYVPGSPADYAIVQYDAWANLDCEGCSIDSMTKNVAVSISGNQTVAVLSIELKYSQTVCSAADSGGGLIYYPEDSDREKRENRVWKLEDGGDGGDEDDSGVSCSTSYYSESATFEDREISPSQFIFPTKQAITIEKYRGVVPKEIIKFRDMDEGIIAYRITTGNGSVMHRRKIGRIETTTKGTFFMNLTLLSVWEKTGSGIYHWRDDPIMGDDEITDIIFDTAYGPALNIDFRSEMVYHENKETNIQPGVWSVIYLVLIFFTGIYIMHKSSRF